ncbi:hypothetical protein EV356DRAFT_303724 [Viridothelium virens]|uniref:Heterokaryon incompatibility domain-containing protein n=1 Tax=Viridothelium virens TaxID=1048519 RepID=A0A6A6HK93_VIRVR|nr:hypothetical protein EV356DRAFT_303724 [Viridothelium virens]
MLLDTAKPFGQDYVNDNDYRQAMLAIQKHQLDRGTAANWANHLRFLTADGEPKLPTGPGPNGKVAESYSDDDEGKYELSRSETDESGSVCACENHVTMKFRKSGRQLKLTGASENPFCVHYLAVSYCCESANRVRKPNDMGSNYTINTSSGIRQSKLDFEVLDRAISFARPRKLSYIWIDQECIDQEDERDQREGIQAMDLVYQRAVECLGLLDVQIADQRHIDALNAMFDGEDISDDLLHALADVLELILSDRWFTRAWILQESLAGAVQMTLQMKCNPNLEKGAFMEPMFSLSSEYLEIELTQLHAYLSTWLPTTVEYMTANSTLEPAIADRLTNIMEKWFGLLPPQVPVDYEGNRRLACNAAAAVSYLNRRENAVISDRIAIMANLCDYKKRLDTMELDRLGYNFSLCAFVLSIMNGDISLLQGYVHPLSGHSGRTDDLTRQSQQAANKGVGFSWSLPQWATLSSLRYLETELTNATFELHPSTLTQSGWLLDGWLFSFDHAIDLSPVRTMLAAKWDLSEPKKLSIPTLSTRPFLVDMMIQLLSFLVETGYTGVAELFWDITRYQPPKRQLQPSPETEAYCKASFNQIIDMKTGKITWSNPIKMYSDLPEDTRRRLGIGPYQDPFQKLYDSENFYVWRIFKAIVLDGSLPIGRLDNGKVSLDTYQAFFDNACVGNLYFAPAEYCEGSIKARHFNRWQPRAFPISRTPRRSTESYAIFACQGLDQGEWLIDPMQIERVCLE